MANDGGMIAQFEEWVVTRLRSLAIFETREVEVYPGIRDRGGHFIQEVKRKARGTGVYVGVGFVASRALDLEEGAKAYVTTYELYLAVQNDRGDGTPRIGDGDTPGISKYWDEIRAGLDDRNADGQVATHGTDYTEVRGLNIVEEATDGFVATIEVVVRESPK